MSLIKCPECNKQVSGKARECPGCGYPIQGKTSNPVATKTSSATLPQSQSYRYGYPVANKTSNPVTNKTFKAILPPPKPDNHVVDKLHLLDIFAGYTLSKEVICPHCQKHGCVMTKPSKIKKGISGGKATGALLNLGASILFTGLSRKEQVTEAQCKNCNSVWHF